MTKEEILNEHMGLEGLTPDAELTECAFRSVYKAMDDYAKTISISFAEWVIENCSYTCGEWTCKVTKHRKPHTTEELFSIFGEHLSTNKQ